MKKLAQFCKGIGLVIILSITLLSLPVLAADNQPSSQGFGTAKPGDSGRKDNVFGNTDENIIMGRDKQSGDNVISIQPKPRPKQEYELPPITVEPQIHINTPAARGD